MDWQLGLALLASFVVARRIAVRLVAKGHRQFVWVVFAPTLLALSFSLWMALKMLAIQPLAAIGIAVVVGPSLLLFVRMIRGMASDGVTPGTAGEASGPFFDYVVWASIGAPMLLGLVLVVLLLTGGLGQSN